MVKILMSWDIKPGSESEYFEFIVREFAPGIMKLGVQPTEAWYTVFGDGPQILTGAIAEDLATMKSILASDDWCTGAWICRQGFSFASALYSATSSAKVPGAG